MIPQYTGQPSCHLFFQVVDIRLNGSCNKRVSLSANDSLQQSSLGAHEQCRLFHEALHCMMKITEPQEEKVQHDFRESPKKHRTSQEYFLTAKSIFRSINEAQKACAHNVYKENNGKTTLVVPHGFRIPYCTNF